MFSVKWREKPVEQLLKINGMARREKWEIMRALNIQVTTFRGVSLNNEVTLFVTQTERSFLWFIEKVQKNVASHSQNSQSKN
jgi:hypothetical protein